MRNLLRNQRPIWYRLYAGQEAIRDADGFDTGETEVSYGDPVEVRAYVAAASGDAAVEAFGVGTAYDRVAYLPGTGWPLDERTVVYVDRDPAGAPVTWDGATGTWSSSGGARWTAASLAEADYAVVRVSSTINQTQVALRKVRDR